MEVTEEFISDEQAEKVDNFIRKSNSLRGKGEIDADDFLKSIDFGPPDSRLQCDMADRVIAAVEKKANKGRNGGSYKSLVRDYGTRSTYRRFAPMVCNFSFRTEYPVYRPYRLRNHVYNFGLDAIKHSVLRASWCPFDSVIVLWNPMFKSIDAWVRTADPDFYLDSC